MLLFLLVLDSRSLTMGGMGFIPERLMMMMVIMLSLCVGRHGGTLSRLRLHLGGGVARPEAGAVHRGGAC